MWLNNAKDYYGATIIGWANAEKIEQNISL